jgi:hypothetical protein
MAQHSFPELTTRQFVFGISPIGHVYRKHYLHIVNVVMRGYWQYHGEKTKLQDLQVQMEL